jgi:NADPH-dependent 2,4-dienoyl-CoA reductase/sulfur reductase-like enzyme
MGPEIGAHFIDLHHRHGVATHFGVGVQAVEGSAGDLTVQLTDGSELAAATVVVGIGATPNIGWLAGSALLLDDGVVCDAQGRAIDARSAYAVGDVARWLDPAGREYLRVEHWTNAAEQAQSVAQAICHPDSRPHHPLEYVWSDQYDWKIQIVGRPLRGVPTEVLGQFTDHPAKAAALYGDEDGLLVGAVTVNWPKALLACRRLIGLGGSVAAGLAQISSSPQDRIAEKSAPGVIS